MLIGMIVKNEAASIAETLASLRALAPLARIIVFDTGSDDGTVDAALRGDAEVEVRCGFAWRDRYDASYNAMLAELEALASPDEWIFHAHGRRIYAGKFAPPDAAQIVSATEHWSETCDATRVVAYRARWAPRYRGATHEVILRPPGVEVPDSGVRMTRAACDHPRPERFERDLRLLAGETDPRSTFYRAQTLACLGAAALAAGDETTARERFSAAYGTYLERADMRGDGDDNEVVVALWRALQLAPRHVALLRVATRMCYAALSIDPDRGEPWLALAEFCRDVREPALAVLYARHALLARPDPRALFVDPTVESRAYALLNALVATAA